MPTENKRYNQQELHEVLRRVDRASSAHHAAAAEEGMSRSEVLETAQELGFTNQQTAAALANYDEEQQLVRAETELRQISYRRLSGNFIACLSINATLVLTDVWTGKPLWLAIIMAMWGLWLLLQLRGALFPHPDRLRLRARKRLVDLELQKSKHEFKQSVTAGAAKLLSLSAKKIDKGVEKLTK